MANIASAISKMTDIEVGSDAPITEDVLTKFGANINGLIDDSATQSARMDAIENATYGLSVWASTGQSISVSATILTKSLTVTATDFVVIQLGGLSSSLASQPLSVTPSTGGTHTITVKRNSTTIGTVSTTGATPATGNGQLIDKPGAGTFVYTIVVSSTGTATWIGGAYVQRVRA